MIRQEKGIEGRTGSPLLIESRSSHDRTAIYNLHDLGPQAQMMAKDCNNERLAMTLQYVAIGSMIVMAGATASPPHERPVRHIPNVTAGQDEVGWQLSHNPRQEAAVASKRSCAMDCRPESSRDAIAGPEAGNRVCWTVPDHGTQTAGLAPTLAIPTRPRQQRLSLKTTQPLNPNGDHHAVQDDHSRTPATTTADARPAPQGPEAAADTGTLRQGAEDQPRSLEGTLCQARPGSDPSQIASEALEMALKELEDRLPSASPQNDHEPLSLDAAMAFIRRHTPRGKGVTEPADAV